LQLKKLYEDYPTGLRASTPGPAADRPICRWKASPTKIILFYPTTKKEKTKKKKDLSPKIIL
jgi:hypothetical protein